jgi:hypothetical protein
MNGTQQQWSIFGDVHNPMVWTVDDDWFENEKAMRVLPLKQIGSNLSQLIKQIDALSAVTPNTKAMLLYLKKLAEECLNKNLSLYVCGFDHFEAKFAYANRIGNAVLCITQHLVHAHSNPVVRAIVPTTFTAYTCWLIFLMANRSLLISSL